MKIINVLKSIADGSAETEPEEPLPDAFEAAQAAMDRAIEERRKAMPDRRQEPNLGPPPGMKERRSGVDRRGTPIDRRTESALPNDATAERRSGFDRSQNAAPKFGKRGAGD